MRTTSQDETTQATPPTRRRARWAPAAVAAAVALVLGGGAMALSQHRQDDKAAGSRSANPPVLTLQGTATGTGTGTGTGAGAGTPASPVPTERLGAGAGRVQTRGGYLLVGRLPTGDPGRASAFTFPARPVGRSDVVRLARALHLSGAPVRSGPGWLVPSSGGRVLTVPDAPGARWYLQPGDLAGSNTSSSVPSVRCIKAPCPGNPPVQCIKAPCPGSPVSPPGPGAPAAIAAARPVLAALGLADADVTAVAGTPYTQVLARPRLDGRPALGLETTLDIAGDGTIMVGSGWLARPERAASYPLITAARAFVRLRALPPLARPLVCVQRSDGPSSCGGTGPLRVTGAHPGLTTVFTAAGAPMLVPAWLFTVADQQAPVPVVAIADRYVRDAAPSGPPAAGPGAGCGSGNGRNRPPVVACPASPN